MLTFTARIDAMKSRRIHAPVSARARLSARPSCGGTLLLLTGP